MEALRLIGYIILSIIGLCAAIGIAAVLAAIGASVGIFALGGFIVVLIAVALEEYFHPSETKDRDT